MPAIKRILIIGASGFIGRRLTKKLAEAGHGVVVAKRRGSVTSEVAGENLKIVILPDDTYDGLPGAISGTAIDMIVNCAAYGVHPHDRDPNQMYIVNVALPVALVELAARKQAGLIHLGSSAEYAAGGLESPVSEDATVEAYKFYGGSKYCGGALMNLKARAIDVPSAVLRLFNVFGPGEGDHRLLPTLTGKLHRRERAALSAGNQIRDFIYVDDVVAAIVAAMNALHDGLLSGGEFFNVSTGIGTPVRQFVMLAASAMKADPGLLGFGDVPVRPDEVPLLVGNNQRFAAATGWEPKFSLSAGIQAAISEAEMDKA